jgi:hypothetical protein
MGFKGDAWAVPAEQRLQAFTNTDKKSHFRALWLPKKLIFRVLFNKIHRCKVEEKAHGSFF